MINQSTENSRLNNKNGVLKRLTLILLIFSVFVSVGCSAGVPEDVSSDQGKKVKIVTAFYPIHHFTKNLVKGIESVELANLTPPQTGCLHDYVLTPKDMKTLESADILIINGGGMEAFMDQVVSSYPDLKVIIATEGMELLEESHDGEGHDEEHAYNPHVWVSVSGAIAEVRNISQGLKSLDSVNKEAYDKNEKEYLTRLEALKKEMDGALKPIAGKRIITFHEAFPYFAKEYDLQIAAVIEREPGSEPTAEELIDTINLIKSDSIRVLFTEPQYPNKAAQVIAQETGAKVFQLDPFVTGSVDDDLDSYEKVMRSNKDVLLGALR